MNGEKKNNTIIIFIIAAVLFGSVSGAVASLVVKSYFDDYITPIAGEINFSDGTYRRSVLEIRDAKKVVVEQNDQAEGTINSVRSTLVGIFKKITPAKPAAGSTARPFDPSDYYAIGEETGEGFVITSDGWIVTNLKLDRPADYVVVTSDKKAYPVTGFIDDKATDFYFLRVDAKDFPVRKFATPEDIKNGQLVLSIGWQGEAILSSIADKDEEKKGLVRSSDSFFSTIRTTDDLSGGLALFSLGGDIIGFIGKDGKAEPITHFTAAFSSLLKEQAVKRPSLGLNYIDTAGLAAASPAGTDSYSAGAVIYKDDKGIAVTAGGAAASAGLKEGDLIISLGNIKLDQNNNLTDIMQRFQAGETVAVSYSRLGEKKEIQLKLGELK